MPDQFHHARKVFRAHFAAGLVELRDHAALAVEDLEVGAGAALQPDKIAGRAAHAQARFKQARALLEHKAHAFRLCTQRRSRHGDVDTLAASVAAGPLHAVETAISKAVDDEHLVDARIEADRCDQGDPLHCDDSGDKYSMSDVNLQVRASILYRK